MRQKKRKRRSKLKLRPYGVITVSTGEPDELSTNFMPTPRQEVSRKTAKQKSKTHQPRREPAGILSTTLNSLLKGSTVLLLIALAIGWITTEPLQLGSHLNNSNETDIGSLASTSDIPITVDQTSLATAPSTVQDDNAPEEKPVQAISDVAIDISSTSKSVENLTENNQTETASILIVPAPEVIETTTNPEENTSTTEEPANTSNSTNTTADIERTDEGTITAYRATVFSSLTADAIETRVAHGASVKILENARDWIKIEIPDNQIIGYIHFSQLSIK